MVSQIRRHGAEHDDRQSGRRSVFTEWRTCYRAAGARDRVQFQSHLPPESADGQAKGPEGIHAVLIFSFRRLTPELKETRISVDVRV